MSAKTVALADAIVSRINGGSYSQSVTAVRRMATTLTVESLSTVQVSVVTGTTTTERLTRNAWQRVYKPIVFIHQKLTGSEAEQQTAADALQLLAEQIDARLAGVDLAGLAFDGFEGGTERETYSAADAKQFSVFTASIQLQYTD